jgi:hypothetical protein
MERTLWIEVADDAQPATIGTALAARTVRIKSRRRINPAPLAQGQRAADGTGCTASDFLP